MNKPDPKDLRILRDHASQRLQHGPYSVPKTRIGASLFCAAHGLQVVAGWYGPKQWPRARVKGRPQLIVCGDLVRALSLETRETVALHWGVHPFTVVNWRKKLGITGTPTASGIEFKRAKMRVMRAKQPDSWVTPGLRYFEKLSPAERKLRMPRVAEHRMWSSAEVDKLRALDNKQAAKDLGRSYSSVANARQRLKVRQPSIACLCRFCHYKWQSRKGVLPKVCAKCKRKAWRVLDPGLA